MPPPTSDFSKLSLGTMPPTTRAQAQSSSQAEDPDDTTGGPEDDDEDNGDLVVETCQQLDGAYIAIQMSKKVHFAVRMGPPGGTYDPPRCECGERQPCDHLRWLLERIVDRTIPEPSKAATLGLWIGGIAAAAPDPYLHVSSIGVNALEALLQRPEPRVLSNRWREVRDILGVLSPVASDQYRPDIFDLPPQDLTLEDAMTQRDLEAVMAASLMSNNTLFSNLSRNLPPDARDTDFFVKKAAEAQSNLASLDDYVRTRGTEPDGSTHDISWCAATLTAIVASIHHRVMDPHPQRLSLQAKEEAARSLITILTLTTNRNIDVYTSPVWGLQPRQRALPLPQRNLFNALIGSWAAGRPRFVLDELDKLADVLPGFVSQLETIVDLLRSNRAPNRFIDHLGTLIKRLKSADAPGAGASGSGSGGKRRGDGGKGSEAKRMKGAK